MILDPSFVPNNETLDFPQLTLPRRCGGWIIFTSHLELVSFEASKYGYLGKMKRCWDFLRCSVLFRYHFRALTVQGITVCPLGWKSSGIQMSPRTGDIFSIVLLGY